MCCHGTPLRPQCTTSCLSCFFSHHTLSLHHSIQRLHNISERIVSIFKVYINQISSESQKRLYVVPRSHHVLKNNQQESKMRNEIVQNVNQSNLIGSILGSPTNPFATGRLLGVTWPPGLPRTEPLPGLHSAVGGGPMSLETVHGISNRDRATNMIYRDSSRWRVG
jgi:hypothetical protein